MGDGAHLVGHSYVGLGVMFAAALRPDATLSLTLLEAGTFALGQNHPAARALVGELRQVWYQDLPDDEWVVRFLTAIGRTRIAIAGIDRLGRRTRSCASARPAALGT